MNRKSEGLGWPLPLSVGVGVGAAGTLVVAALAALLWHAGRAPAGDRSSGDARLDFAGDWIETVRADVGRGEYLFLPCRREMWVVNQVNGRLVHYQFFDNELGTVERSRVAEIKDDRFPLRDTEFILSDRNLNSLLWVCNRATGDFQLWQANRDGSLTTHEKVAEAGSALRETPVEPVQKRRDRWTRQPAGAAQESAPARTPGGRSGLQGGGRSRNE